MRALRVVGPESHRVMPWRNGLGVTREILVHPPGAPLDAFEWRVSLAELEASGPFSEFPGYDRVIVPVLGSGMTLSHEGAGERRLALLEPYAFAGELATRCTLDAPARDFNVMVDRDRASAEVVPYVLAPGVAARLPGGVESAVLHVLEGSVSVRAGTESVVVERGETLVATTSLGLDLEAGASGATALGVLLGPPVRDGRRRPPPREP